MKDTSVVTVPSAYSAGEVTFVVMPQISIGSVFFAPAVSSVRGNSSYDSVKPNSATAIMPGKQDRHHHQPENLPVAGAQVAARLLDRRD